MDGSFEDYELPQDLRTTDSWDLRALDTSSGTAYMGRMGGSKVFVKVNAHPLLPSVANAGLTPKVLWIRKLSNEDTMIAQPWIEGHTLRPDEMIDPQVNSLLQSLHTNRKLHDTLISFDKGVVRPQDLINEVVAQPDSPINRSEFLRHIAASMMDSIPSFNSLNNNIIHGDVSSENWIKEEGSGKIYLLDWDTVSLGDPFIDVAHILSHYVPQNLWNAWLSVYGYSASDISVMAKIIWYGRLSFLRKIYSFFNQGNTAGANGEILGLRKFNENF